MTPDEKQRFLRELHGDFSEVDADLRASWKKALVFAVLLAALLAWAVLMNYGYA